MNEWVKRIIEALVCGVFFFLISWFFDRSNPKWLDITISSLIFMVAYFIVSLIIDKTIGKKLANKKE